MVARLKELYVQTIQKAMTDEFGYSNIMMVPKLDKIVINMGVGEASQDKKKIDGPLADLERIKTCL